MSAELVVSITTPLLALVIAFLWYKTLQQAKLVRELATRVTEVHKDLTERRAQQEAANVIPPEVAAAAALVNPKRKRPRKR